MQIEKNVFVVFYSGEKVKNKILKICEAFGANRYSFPEDLGKQAQMITEVCIILLVELADHRLYDFFWEALTILQLDCSLILLFICFGVSIFYVYAFLKNLVDSFV